MDCDGHIPNARPNHSIFELEINFLYLIFCVFIDIVILSAGVPLMGVTALV